MSPKAKHFLASDHLDLAQEEIEEGRLGVAATLLLRAAEAAIDALAEKTGQRRRRGRMPEHDAELRWRERLAGDRDRVGGLQPAELRATVAEVLERLSSGGAKAVALTGSTARGRRTAISDLDFHMVGMRPDLSGVPGEVDVVADSPARFQRRLAEGDDLIQWTLRLGWVLHDPDRIFMSAFDRILREDLWPDPDRKFERAEALASLAERVAFIEDQCAAQEQVRAGLTSLARGLLLAERVFPLARDELAAQLREAGYRRMGDSLHRSIHETLGLDELRLASRELRREAHARRTRPSKDIDALPEAA